MDAQVYQLEANQSETRAKVKETEDGLNELYTGNFYMAIFKWQFLFARVDDEK